VTGVVVDKLRPHLVHSCCTDKSLVTLDLKQERRVQHFSVAEGAFAGIVQSVDVDGEQEILTVDSAGCVKVYLYRYRYR